MPSTFKMSASVDGMETKMRQAMSDIGFNLKYVRDNPYAGKIAGMQFKQLVKSLDRDHSDFLKVMDDDPSVDSQKLHQYFGKNYTDQLKLNRMKVGGRDSDDELDVMTGKPLNLLKPIDSYDKKRFKEGKLNFIGIQSRVNTNRKLTKAQLDLANRTRIHEKKMARQFSKKLKSQKRQNREARRKKDQLTPARMGSPNASEGNIPCNHD